MKIKFVLAGVGFAIGIAFALDVEPAMAFKEIPIQGTFTRAEVSAVCRANGGIETGTTPGTTGGFGCVGTRDDQGSVQCNDKGKCVGIPPARVRNPIPNQPRPAPQSELEAILGGR